MPSKVIRDPVHNHIYFDKDDDRLILELLRCPEMQRLRRIRQLGVSYLTYPGAEHSRFSHSLGVCHLMKQALRYVSENQENAVEVSDENRVAILAAALLHDVGHGPFSHLLEQKFGGHHEKRSTILVESDETGVNKALCAYDRELPSLVSGIITGEQEDVHWLRALISSQLDVDRMDYLLRDSHFCGVGYGRFDRHYLFHTMRIRQVPPESLLQLVWLYKARHVIEEYLFARYYMYWNVYYHHTTKGYEELVKSICERAREVVRDGVSLPGWDPVLAFVQGDDLSIGQFLSLDDSVLISHFVEWQRADDSILRDLCTRFLNRDGLKFIDTGVDGEESTLELTQAIREAQDHLARNGFDPRYYLRESAPSAKMYDYYHPEKDTGERTPANSILIEQPGNVYEEISLVHGMERLRAVTGRRERRRLYYVPEEQRNAVKEILEAAD